MNINRRSVLALGAALGASLALAGCQTASPALGPGGSIGAIVVDIAPLAAQGWGPNAALVKTTLENELAGIFAGRILKGAPRLVVRVNSILMPSYVGGSSRGGGRFGGGDGGGNTDYMDSEARLVGPRGETLATFPVLSAVPSAVSGTWYLQDIDTRRLQSLARHNASWIGRSVAGR